MDSGLKEEVARGYNGNESVDPLVALKLLFLLFFNNVKSEREQRGNLRSRGWMFKRMGLGGEMQSRWLVRVRE